MLCGIARRPAAPRSCASRSHRALGPVVLGCAALLLTAGCGQTAAASSPSSAGPSGSASRSVTAYLTCLRQHGFNVPTARPAAPPTARPTGRPSGFGAGNATFQKARQACASLRPAGGFGFGGGRFAAAFQAFRSCMASHGVTIPATRPAAPPASPPASGAPGAGRFLNGLNPSDPKVAAALKACQPRLPTFTRPSGSPSAAAA